MKTQPWLVAVALVVGLVLGICLPGDWSPVAGDASDPGEEARPSPKIRTRAVESRRGLTDLRERVRKASPASAPDVLATVLQGVPDEVRRMELVLEMFRVMDASNCIEMFEQFEKATEETGRVHPHAWEKALIHMGTAGGARAVEFHLNREDGPRMHQAWQSLYGWALTAPEDAMRWLDEVGRDDPELRGRLVTAAVAGGALVNPDLAIEHLEKLPAEERSRAMGDFTWNLVQSGGIERAVDWAERAAGSGDEAYATEVGEAVFNRMVDTAVGRVLPERMSLLTRLHASTPLRPGHMQRVFRQVDPAEAMGFLKTLRGNPAFRDVAGDPGVVQAAIARASENEGMGEVLERNPEVRELLEAPPPGAD